MKTKILGTLLFLSTSLCSPVPAPAQDLVLTGTVVVPMNDGFWVPRETFRALDANDAAHPGLEEEVADLRLTVQALELTNAALTQTASNAQAISNVYAKAWKEERAARASNDGGSAFQTVGAWAGIVAVVLAVIGIARR